MLGSLGSRIPRSYHMCHGQGFRVCGLDGRPGASQGQDIMPYTGTLLD